MRRPHDLDRSGWWFLLILVPVVGWIGSWSGFARAEPSARTAMDPIRCPTNSARCRRKCMAEAVILLGEAAALGVRALDIRCKRCERHGRLAVARVVEELTDGANLA